MPAGSDVQAAGVRRQPAAGSRSAALNGVVNSTCCRGNRLSPVIGVLAAPGVVDELIRNDQPARRRRRRDAADRIDAEHVVHAQLAQRPDVGPVVDPVRRDGRRIRRAVARKKDHLVAVDAHDAAAVRRRRTPGPRCQLRQGVPAAAGKSPAEPVPP